METSTESQLLQFLYACPVGLIECDAAGKIGMINPHAMQHLFPLAGDRDLTNLFTALQDYAPELRGLVARFAKPIGRVCDGHRIVVHLSGGRPRAQPMVLACTIVRLGPDRLMATLSDVSIEVAREKRLAEAEGANVAKSQFLANISHEIRTPLNGVLGMAQALALDSLPPSQHEKVQTIRDAGRSLLLLLNDILDLSKIEAGQFKLETAPFDFEQMTRTTCAIFAETARAKGLPVVFTTRGDAQGHWEGDADRCRQIVSNLVSNAIKFTTSGEVRVELERSESGAVLLRVSDTGVGIDAAELSKLFSKFYQGDSSTTRRFGGGGLGLSICHELSRMMGGAVTVDSVLGAGSTFTLELPLKFLGAGATGTAAAAIRARSSDQGVQGLAREGAKEGGIDHALPPHTPRKLHVLVAEDNLTNQVIIKTLLRAFNVDVIVVENGRLAVEAWEGGAFDLILMDIQMPDMDGVAATQRIRDLEEERGRTRTPILAVTANIMNHQIAAYRQAGMDGYVAKPIQLEELSEALVNATYERHED